MTASEKVYAIAIRTNRHRFIRKAEAQLSAEQVAEAKASFMHFDQNHDNAMDKLEFKAANAAMSITFKDEKLLDKTFAGTVHGMGCDVPCCAVLCCAVLCCAVRDVLCCAFTPCTFVLCVHILCGVCDVLC